MEVFFNRCEQEIHPAARGGGIELPVAMARDVHEHIAHERCQLEGAMAFVDGGDHHRVGIVAALCGAAVRADEEHVDELAARVVFRHFGKLFIGQVCLFVKFRNRQRGPRRSGGMRRGRQLRRARGRRRFLRRILILRLRGAMRDKTVLCRAGDAAEQIEPDPGCDRAEYQNKREQDEQDLEQERELLLRFRRFAAGCFIGSGHAFSPQFYKFIRRF